MGIMSLKPYIVAREKSVWRNDSKKSTALVLSLQGHCERSMFTVATFVVALEYG